MRESTWSNELIQLFVLSENDVVPSYVDWLNDSEVNHYLESRFEVHTLESTRQFVKNCVENDNILLLGIRFPLLENQHIGNIKLEMNKLHGLGEVGIMIGEKKAYGKGAATQAIRLLAQIAREELELRKLTAGCYESNRASERAFIKAGFVIEGKRPEHFLINGQAEGLTLMGMML